MIEILARRRTPFSLASVRARIEALLAAAGRPGAELSLLLAGDAEIRRLNRRFRKVDRTTDVLSFPGGGGAFLGDLALSLDAVRRQARVHGHTMLAELTVLCAHGILHLCGYDHEAGPHEAMRMRRKERALLSAVGVREGPLTGRRAPAGSRLRPLPRP